MVTCREPSFGHGTLDVSPFKLLWSWHRNQVSSILLFAVRSHTNRNIPTTHLDFEWKVSSLCARRACPSWSTGSIPELNHVKLNQHTSSWTGFTFEQTKAKHPISEIRHYASWWKAILVQVHPHEISLFGEDRWIASTTHSLHFLWEKASLLKWTRYRGQAYDCCCHVLSSRRLSITYDI